MNIPSLTSYVRTQPHEETLPNLYPNNNPISGVGKTDPGSSSSSNQISLMLSRGAYHKYVVDTAQANMGTPPRGNVARGATDHNKASDSCGEEKHQSMDVALAIHNDPPQGENELFANVISTQMAFKSEDLPDLTTQFIRAVIPEDGEITLPQERHAVEMICHSGTKENSEMDIDIVTNPALEGPERGAQPVLPLDQNNPSIEVPLSQVAVPSSPPQSPFMHDASGRGAEGDTFDWEPMSIERQAEESGLSQRYHLINVINALVADLEHWCALPMQNAAAESHKSADVPPPLPPYVLGGDERIGSSTGTTLYPELLCYPYSPDYTKAEPEVIEDALCVAAKLRNLIVLMGSLRGILNVWSYMKNLRGRLTDIGISKETLNCFDLKRLTVAKIVLQLYGPEDWVIEDLYQCAANCVEAGVLYGGSWQASARTAAEAARHLVSMTSMHSEFYRAISLHYQALTYDPENNIDEHRVLVRQSMARLCVALHPNPPCDYVREMIRAMLTFSDALDLPNQHEELLLAFGPMLAHAPTATCDPTLAELLAELVQRLLSVEWRNGYHNRLLDDVLSLTTDIIGIFTSLRRTRPSRFQPALVRLLKTYASGLFVRGRYHEAMHALEEAINVQQKLATFGDKDAIVCLFQLTSKIFRNQIHLRRWKQVLSTASRLVELIRSPYGVDITPHSPDCLDDFRTYLQCARDPQALAIVRSLIDAFRPLLESHHSPKILSALTRVLLTVSDLQRGLGAFEPALNASREALAISREVKGSSYELSTMTYIEVLTCHAYSLMDSDAYEEATSHLQDMVLSCDSPLDTESSLKQPFPWANQLGVFSVVQAYFHGIRVDPLSIDKVVIRSRACTDNHSAFPLAPCWLSSITTYSSVRSKDTLAWLLLIRSVTNPTITQASASAKEALALMCEYYQQNHRNMVPSTRASLLGHKYILQCILGLEKEGKEVLDEAFELYRSVLIFEPYMARLPLLILLEILLILSRRLGALHFATPQLQIWKKNVYQGSLSVFEELFIFLRGFTSVICHRNGISAREINQREASIRVRALDGTSATIGGVIQTQRSHQKGERPRDAPRVDKIKDVSGCDIIGLCRASPPTSTNAVIIDLPGKTIHFTNNPPDSPNSRKPSDYNSKFDPDAVPNLSGHIKIVKGPLCAGGFCDVYSGELMRQGETDSPELVAMKMLRIFNTEAHVVKAKKKFRREVRLWCLLQHPNVLPFYGTCELDEIRLFMVSPWAQEGNSLEYLRRHPYADRGRLLWQTASALEYLHSGRDAPQIVHGDLKADNVLVSAEGDALLGDFGLSCCVEEIISKPGSSSTSRIGGHARFLAPELLVPPKDSLQTSRPTPESDVFAFASLMLQIYTEQPPFGDLREIHAILKVASGELPPRPVELIILERGLGDRIWTVMTDCWQLAPRARPSMQAVRARLSPSVLQ